MTRLNRRDLGGLVVRIGLSNRKRLSMQVINSTANASLSQPFAVAIGNFDGCHIGHQSLISATQKLAIKHNSKVGILTFSPHPEIAFGSISCNDLLFTREQKESALRELGIDIVAFQAFDEEFSKTTADDFYHNQLRKHLHAKAIVIGKNFRFGHKRTGDGEYLTKLAAYDQVEVNVAKHVEWQTKVISSSSIRQMLRKGDIEAATQQLGRPYSLWGKIVDGAKNGRKIGFPTLNLEKPRQLIPTNGVYAGHLEVADSATEFSITVPKRKIPAVFNVGQRPTLNGINVQVEGHAINTDLGQVYGKSTAFHFEHFLRPERKFDSLANLKTQIGRDINSAKALLNSH